MVGLFSRAWCTPRRVTRGRDLTQFVLDVAGAWTGHAREVPAVADDGAGVSGKDLAGVDSFSAPSGAAAR